MNDPPTAAADSYSVSAGGTLSVSTPGVLSNDTDVDSSALATQLVTSPTKGTLTLSANGSFTFTPVSGYSGPDSFTYRTSDGSLVSAAVTVNLTVTPAAPTVIFDANLNSTSNSFTYVDNVFRSTAQGAYASGSRVSTGGFTGGALRVLLGGINDNAIIGMSGGWLRTFTLSAPASLTLSFRYNLDQGIDYESDELSQVLASLNGVLVAVPPSDFIAEIAGNGNGGTATTTGWQLFQISLGTLPAGTHKLILGGYNSKKTTTSERTTILIDDVTVTSAP